MIKNKRSILILAFICILVVIFGALILGNSKNNSDVKNQSWMSNISDEKKLSEITIPGVHNAAASRLPLSLFARCQNQSIAELLNEGYRYLDIRAGVDDIAGEKELVLYHNFIPCYSSEGIIPRKLTFDDVVKSCYDFLEDNPSETIIFMLKYEHGEVSVLEFEELVDQSIEEHGDKWLLTDETPTLKEARGKIVLYRRYEDEASLGSRAGIECIWNNQKDTEISDLNSIFATTNEDGLFVQDMYKLGADDKWKVFSQVYTGAFERENSYGRAIEQDNGKAIERDNTDGNFPTINFLSTAGSKSVGVPIYYAKILNKKFMEYALEEDACPEWIIVDFGDAKIADKIIGANN